MFIVNQYRDLMQNLDNISFIQVRGKQIITGAGRIADYATAERAKEVFEEMINALSPAIVMQNVEIDKEMMKQIQNTPFVVAKNDVRIETVCPIYKMPLE